MASNPPIVRALVVDPPAVRVTVGTNNPKVTTVQYGSRALKDSIDLNFSDPIDGGVIVFRSATNNFDIVAANSVISTLDNGFF